jgi:60 kDa SS-A/Ro ribonucleoprotein
MRTNVVLKTAPVFTAEGARATKTDAFHELKRSVMTCLLWEDAFYRSGSDIAKRIVELIPKVKPEQVAVLACEARDRMFLRHVPLFLVSELSKIKGNGPLVRDTLAHVIQRADELAEFIAIYRKDKRRPLSSGVKQGLAKAFTKFGAYALAKYNRPAAYKLRDVLFLCHAKPKDPDQATLWKRLITGELVPPDTWEVALSAGKDKRETFERLIREDRLGGLALLRNLRGMLEAKVNEALIRKRLADGADKALPFRYIAAAKHAPRLEDSIEVGMLAAVQQMPKLPGSTLIVIDVSGSMAARLSAKSEIDRIEAACGVAILAREICERATIYATAGSDYKRIHATALVPSRRGFALRDAIKQQYSMLGGGGIFLAQCMDHISQQGHPQFERVIVFTDEQDCDLKLKPGDAKLLGRHNYLVNVSNEKNGIVYGTRWDQIDGWSEHLLTFIRENEIEESETLQAV